MKSILTLLALVTGMLVLTPTTSEARDHHRSSSRSHSHDCRSCGSSVYRERCVTSRDRYGRPVYGWRTVSHSCRSKYSHGHGHGHGHGHHHGSSRGHSSHRHGGGHRH